MLTSLLKSEKYNKAVLLAVIDMQMLLGYHAL